MVGLELDTWSLVVGLMTDFEVSLEKGSLETVWRDWWKIEVVVAVVGERIGVVELAEVVALAIAMVCPFRHKRLW